MIREWDPLKQKYVDPGDGEESFDEDSDDEFDYLSSSEREEFKKIVKENEAAVQVIHQAEDDYPWVPGDDQYNAHEDPNYCPSECIHFSKTEQGLTEIGKEENIFDRLKDFEDMELGDFSKDSFENEKTFKTDWGKTISKYFKLTENLVPNDPVAQRKKDIKTEIQKESEQAIKSEPVFEIPEKIRRNPNREFKCRLCPKKFKSKYAFTIHVNKHPAKCVNCHVTYKSWGELRRHEPYCSRRFGRTIIPPRPPRAEKKKPKPFKCQLCDRKYEKYAELYDHQVKRCKKRYVSEKWVVKI